LQTYIQQSIIDQAIDQWQVNGNQFSAVRYWPSCCTQVLHGQASVLQQTTANLTGFSTDLENYIAVSS